MYKKLILLILINTCFYLSSFTQFLSNLNVTKDEALFTTYAAPLSRSEYKADQGYQLSWQDNEQGIEMISKDGLNFGIAFQTGKNTKFKLGELFREPIITTSYSDLVKYYYYPFKDIRVEVFFDVYSSKTTIEDVRISNEGSFPMELNVLPYCYYSSENSKNDIDHETPNDLYSFPIQKKRDGWMLEHAIPLMENFSGIALTNLMADSIITFSKPARSFVNNDLYLVSRLQNSFLQTKKNAFAVKGLIYCRSFRIYPGEPTHFRMIYSLEDAEKRLPDVSRKLIPLFKVDLNEIIKEDEKIYTNIPDLSLSTTNDTGQIIGSQKPEARSQDFKLLYWSAFSLMRQCMMPAEGECHQNYYVFSREPKWGWGYGGQVFHESLTMLAYSLMDPAGSMNSQRVYFERQHSDGYINYRTGPYLNETIEYNHQLTSSAPWLNYESLEIYKITKDKKFLREAYESGKKFYNYYISNRDTNHNGLCEWGAEASLESVRDARVAVWDKVGWPDNFEGADVNSMLVKEAKSLAEMAEILGFQSEKTQWLADAKSRSDLINKYMWDNTTGFYYNINKKNQTFTFHATDDLKIKEIIGFLPLWAGIADAKQAEMLVKKMKDPEEFWRRYGVPTLSAKDDYYNPIGYWNGPVWVQWDYLLFRGLIDYGYKNEAKELAYKVLDNMIYHLKKDHVFWEFYSADDRQAGWNKTYIWAGIATRFLFDIYGITKR